MKVNGEHYRTIRVTPEDRAVVEIIDQRLLPHQFKTVSLTTVSDAHLAIKEMLVRGAGLIGATAGFGMYLASLSAGDGDIHEVLGKTAFCDIDEDGILQWDMLGDG